MAACNTQETAKQLALYIIPMFLNLFSLDSYAICEKHYNQVIATNKFCQHLIGSNQENKRSRLIQDASIRVRHSDPTIELERTRRLLEHVRLLYIRMVFSDEQIP